MSDERKADLAAEFGRRLEAFEARKAEFLEAGWAAKRRLIGLEGERKRLSGDRPGLVEQGDHAGLRATDERLRSIAYELEKTRLECSRLGEGDPAVFFDDVRRNPASHGGVACSDAYAAGHALVEHLLGVEAVASLDAVKVARERVKAELAGAHGVLDAAQSAVKQLKILEPALPTNARRTSPQPTVDGLNKRLREVEAS